MSAKVTAVTVTRANDLVGKPWKNGTGVTREVANHPPGSALDAFAWRISLADVAQAGPFSQFEGIDRTLVLLEGAGMRLTEANGHAHELRKALDVARFPGESRIDAELANGPTRDFNLMVSRALVRADLTVWRDGPFETLGAATLLFFCAQAPAQIVLDTGHTYMLGAHDTLRVDAPHAHGRTVQNLAGTFLAIRLYIVSAA